MAKAPLPVDPRGQEFIKLLSRDQYERWLNREIEQLLYTHFNEVAHLLLDNPSALTLGASRRASLLFVRASRVIQEGYDKAESLTAKQLLSYTGVEAQAAKAQLQGMIFDSDVFRATMGNLTRAELKAIATMPIEGLPLGEWWKKQVTDMTFATRQQIQLGMVAGESPDKIARRIMPTQGQVTPAVWKRARNNSNILVRTSITTVQNQAAFMAYQTAGEEVTDTYRYVSARDNRVTPICRALDGQIFSYKKPTLPPQHVRCRSTIVPVINHKKLGLPDPNAGPLTFQSYGQWLKGESETRQNTILGPARADMWRKGQASLEELVATDGRTITLAQLKERIGVVERE